MIVSWWRSLHLKGSTSCQTSGIMLSHSLTPVPVYILYKEADRSSKRTLHWNHLLPIGHASDARTDSQGTSSNQEVTNKHRPRKRTPDATDKEGTFTQFLDKSKSAHKLWGWGWKWVLAEVHEMKMTDSQEGEAAATLTAQEGEQCCDETALQCCPDDSPGTYVGAWNTSRCGDDHHFTDFRGRKFCRPAVYSDQESACSGKQKMTLWVMQQEYVHLRFCVVHLLVHIPKFSFPKKFACCVLS